MIISDEEIEALQKVLLLAFQKTNKFFKFGTIRKENFSF